MAFTKRELWSGTAWAWGAFVVLLLATLALASIVGDNIAGTRPDTASTGWAYLPVVLFYALLIGGGISFVVMVVLSPVIWLIGRLLRRTGAIGVHLGVYAALGATLGMVSVGVVAGGNYDPASFFWSPLLPITVAITTTSVIFGWLRASRHARRELRESDPRSPISLNRAFDETAPY